MRASGRATAFLMIAALVVMWGVSWTFIKVGVAYTPPLLFVGMRTLGGSIPLLIVAFLSGTKPEFRKHWRAYLISALFNVVLFFGLQTEAAQYLPSGLLSVMVYLQPIAVGFLAFFVLKEPLYPLKVVGLICGVLGVAVAGLESMTGHVAAVGVWMGIACGLAWAVGTVYTKRLQGQVPMNWMVAMQFLIGGAIVMIYASCTESWSAIRWTGAFWVSLVYLVFIGVSLSWLVWFALVARGDVSRVTSFTFAVPILSVILGVVFLHEAFSPYLVGGLVLVALGIYLVNAPPFGRKRPRPRVTPREVGPVEGNPR